MPRAWSPWEPDDTALAPYAHWWRHIHGGPDAPEPDLDLRRVEPYCFATPPDIVEEMQDRYEDGAAVPLPPESWNPDWDVAADWVTDAARAIATTWRPPKATVIVGLIDTGISLGHHRFRRPGIRGGGPGRTRFLASWQQNGAWDKGQPYLPFGRELYAGQIDRLIAAHSGPGGYFDQEAFNRAAGLVEPERLRGQRDLDHAAAHGTHVADLATGLDPHAPEAPQTAIIAVNLPPQYVHGTAGHFLQYLAILGFERIVALADALWREVHGTAAPGGYPIALNLAYGQQAGPKDGSQDLERAIRTRWRARDPETHAPCRICLPAGNTNQGQSSARLRLVPGRPQKMPWRVQPSDQTSNFLEIWAPAEPAEQGLPDPSHFDLTVTPPDESLPLRIGVPSIGGHTDLVPEAGGPAFARVYCRVRAYREDDGRAVQRLYFLVCLAPPLVHAVGRPLAPAGLWTVGIAVGAACTLDLHVQSDQAGLVQSRTGLQSYLDHEAYRTHLENGRWRDAYAYPFVDADASDQERLQGPVSRKGTNNALASSAYTAAIAGYRLSDGRPAAYSATLHPEAETDCIVVAYPTDEGPGRFGLLAAGARDGSVVALQGTSMASALATRDNATRMRAWQQEVLAWEAGGKGGPRPDPMEIGRRHLRALADMAEVSRPTLYGDAAPLKVGAGRCRFPAGYPPATRPARGRPPEP